MSVILEILRAIGSRGPLSPGDVVAITGLPRYKVLAVFTCLEELGLVEKIYSKGNHKVYQLSYIGRLILEKGLTLEDLKEALRGAIISDIEVPNASPVQSVESESS